MISLISPPPKPSIQIVRVMSLTPIQNADITDLRRFSLIIKLTKAVTLTY